ncbi:MAG: putative lipid II flippase FtsW [Gammaproteobacteria bacterium]|jgi:cell division protein FtsW|nr:putative lipid II flippase FtsW [Gammaproteobacteria bacterium]MDP6165132.1 putative lipid II flippase FtsW [Gammaproteobacteria bacterium]
MNWLQQQWQLVSDQAWDRALLIPAVALMVIGFIMISSASIDVAAINNLDPFYQSKRQGVFVLLGLIAMFVSLHIPIQFWQKYGPVLMGLAALSLLIVLVPGVGREVNGSVRWIPVGSFSLQPSEFAKVAVVTFMAGYLVRRQSEVRTTIAGFLKPMAVMMIFSGLLLLEPDFGATVVLMGAVIGMFFLGGMRKLHLVAVALVLLPVVGAIAWFSPYRMQRLLTYLEPWQDPFGAGYQLTQAQIAFGRGGWFGEGLGNSMQKLFYLPEAHTDFVYSVLAEEWGAVGALAVVGLYAVLIVRGLRIGQMAERLQRPYAAYLCYGLVFLIAAQAVINIGVNLGLLPTKGLTLPFVSYGGSSMMASATILGILLRISLENSYLLTLVKRRLVDSQRSQKENNYADELVSEPDFVNAEVSYGKSLS